MEVLKLNAIFFDKLRNFLKKRFFDYIDPKYNTMGGSTCNYGYTESLKYFPSFSGSKSKCCTKFEIDFENYSLAFTSLEERVIQLSVLSISNSNIRSRRDLYHISLPSGQIIYASKSLDLSENFRLNNLVTDIRLLNNNTVDFILNSSNNEKI